MADWHLLYNQTWPSRTNRLFGGAKNAAGAAQPAAVTAFNTCHRYTDLFAVA